MEENKINSVSGEEKSNVDTTQDYISAINEIKQNTVSKEAYLKVVDDNKKLLDSLVHGTGIGQDQEQKKPEEPDIDALRGELYGSESNNMTNLEYVDKTLQLRKALMDKGERDPFVTKAGKNYSPELVDFQKAERVASTLQECVDIAQGNPDVFDNEFQRRLK